MSMGEEYLAGDAWMPDESNKEAQHKPMTQDNLDTSHRIYTMPEQENIDEVAQLRQDKAKLLALAKEMTESICCICKIHNPQHKDCEHCEDMDAYQAAISKYRKDTNEKTSKTPC